MNKYNYFFQFPNKINIEIWGTVNVGDFVKMCTCMNNHNTLLNTKGKYVPILRSYKSDIRFNIKDLINLLGKFNIFIKSIKYQI